MKFKTRNLRSLAEMVIGDAPHFTYRSSSRITEFFEECDLEFAHDGSTRWAWTSDRLAELLEESSSGPYALPARFVTVFRVLMQKSDADVNDPGRSLALEALNGALGREGFEAFYDESDFLHIRHIGTRTLSEVSSPHRPFTPAESARRAQLSERSATPG